MEPWYVRYLCKGMTEEEIHLIQGFLTTFSEDMPLEIQEMIIEYYLCDGRSILHPLMQFEKEKLMRKDCEEVTVKRIKIYRMRNTSLRER